MIKVGDLVRVSKDRLGETEFVGAGGKGKCLHKRNLGVVVAERYSDSADDVEYTIQWFNCNEYFGTCNGFAKWRCEEWSSGIAPAQKEKP